MWEIWTRQQPWKELMSDSPWQLVLAVMNDDERPPIPSSCPTDLRKLIEDMWLSDPRKRPDMPTVVRRLEVMLSRLESGRQPPRRSASTGGVPVLEDPRLNEVVRRFSSSVSPCSSSPASSASGSPRNRKQHCVFRIKKTRVKALAQELEEDKRRSRSAKELGDRTSLLQLASSGSPSRLFSRAAHSQDRSSVGPVFQGKWEYPA